MSIVFTEVEEEQFLDISEESMFIFPECIEIIKVDNNNIVIDPSRAVYIVLFNNEQLDIFSLLREGKNIKTLHDKYGDDNKNLQYVVMAIVNVDLCNNQNVTIELPNITDSLFIYLTDLCNLSCLHCYRNNDTLNKMELSVEQWIAIIDKFKMNGGKNVTISGGEPLLHKGFIEICAFVKSTGLSLTILSNGTLWKKYKDKKEDIKIIKKIDEIQISIDGYDEQSNLVMRGKNNFNLVMNNLDWLYKLGINLSVAVTPSPLLVSNETEKNKLEEFLVELSKIAAIRLTHKIIENQFISLTEKENSNYFKFISELENKIYPHGKIKRWVSHYFNETSKENNCGWGNLTISTNGDVYTCNRLDKAEKLGSIFIDNINSLMRKGQICRDITSVDNINSCKFCAVRYLCNGGCRIDEFIELNPMPKRFCSLEKKKKIYSNMVNASKYIYGF